MLRISISLSCVLALLAGTAAPETRGPGCSEEMLAVSMRVLQEQLRACTDEGAFPDVLLHLAGLTVIEGFIFDTDDGDLILFGESVQSRPPLYLEDFVVALRNVDYRYAERQGNTVFYSPPGCTIDPEPSTLRKLKETGSKMESAESEEEIAEILERWRTACEGRQKVGVLGVPSNTRFAKVMVDADYYMKRLVDGSVSLNIEGLVSVTDLVIGKVEEDLRAGVDVSAPLMMMNRFWFHPGENMYGQDEGIVRIEECPVILLTEEEHVSRFGEVVGTGKAGPYAALFARSMTDRYSELALKKPVYAELEGLYRFVAMAKILKEKAIEVDLSHLLDEFEAEDTSVPSYLSGIPNVKDIERRVDFEGGYRIIQLWFPSCGGVSMDIPVNRESFRESRDGRLAMLRSRILEERPSPDTLSWAFVGPSEESDE